MEGSTTLEHGGIPDRDACPPTSAIAARARRSRNGRCARLQPVPPAGASVALFEGEPPFAVAPMPELSTAGKLPGLAVAWAHARSSPLQADPYDGTAFVVAKAIRDAGRDLTHLVLGLPGEAAGPRTVLGRIDELAAFAYELACDGAEPRGLVIRGGVALYDAPPRGRCDDERDALGLAWDKVGSGLPLLYSRYGLPLEELLVDLGAPADAITTHLVATATAMAPGWDPAVSVEVPAARRSHASGGDRSRSARRRR
ncbi:MAG: hypothetical protein U0166_24490 [Acidobacteriota bacterium]